MTMRPELEVYLTTYDGAQHLRLHGWLKRNSILIKSETIAKAKDHFGLFMIYVNDEMLDKLKEANLEEGDLILEINGQISSYPLLFQEFARSKPGTLIKFKILILNMLNLKFRKNQIHDIKIDTKLLHHKLCLDLDNYPNLLINNLNKFIKIDGYTDFEDEREYLIPAAAQILVKDLEPVVAGQSLTGGPKNPLQLTN